MNTPKFKNADLQSDSINLNPIDIDPKDIVAMVDTLTGNGHSLVIDDVTYYYGDEEFNRDHDRDLAMALLLTDMQNNDGVQIIATVDGNEFLANLTAIAEEEGDGSIYITVVDQEDDSHDINVTDITAEGFPMPAASPATKKESIAEATLEAREKYILNNRTTDIRLGDYVETVIHKHRGRVTDISEWCDAGNSNAWFRAQNPPYDKAQKMERWISILIHEGGSVSVAESRVGIVEKFDFVNPYADKYFRDTPSFTAEQIELIKNLAKPLVGDGDNHEYTRGICELIADIDPKGNMAQEERAEELRVELTD